VGVGLGLRIRAAFLVPTRECISCSRDVRAYVSILNRECSFLIQRLVLFIHLSPPTSTMSVPGQQPDRWIKKEHS
jgi:hypothetical protein